MSYSCMENVKNIISKHNSRILKEEERAPPQCDCEEECPVEGQCQQSGVVYQATLHLANDRVKKYVGLTETKFKDRHKEHIRSFEVQKSKNSTTLSKEVWKLNYRRLPFSITWKILRKANDTSQVTHTVSCA